ncbi:MAG: ABC transporter ATP-binding protein [Pseudomonadales bacterium]|nr:ABC transporter ATP-binding protein [Pseudomonadales bacterium]MDP7596129.1 ABC transporter ATP-binding protein [Pseudomonadales bacterium]HJN50679.1 ABC transporter ATP-binding protein [Pseudomonadales bacterium]
MTEEVDEGSPGLTLKTTGKLILRTWPYYRPQLKHVITFLLLNMFMGALLGGATFVGYDLLNNKVFLGKSLQPLQAVILGLDESYVQTGEPGDAGPGAGQAQENSGTESADVFLSDDQRRTVLYRMLVWGAVIGVMLMASLSGVYYYMVWIQQRINQHLRVTMLERAENLSLKFHDQAQTGDAIYRVYQDSATITNVLLELITRPMRMIATMLFLVVVLTFFSPWLGLLILIAVIPVSCMFLFFTPRIQRRSRQARASNSNLTSRIQSVFAAIKVIKANRSEGMVIEQFKLDSQLALDAAFHLRLENILLSTGVIILTVAILLLAEYLMAGWGIAEKATYLGGVVALVGFASWNLGAYQSASGSASEMTRHSRDLVNVWAAAQDLSVGLERAFYLLDQEPEVVEAEQTVGFPTPIRQVSWQETGFAYKTGQPVLKGVNLQAKAGSITAIVGTTGAGKSTLMSLLLRLYDPDSGSILVNDTNIRDLALADLRSNAAIALQQNVLFATTVAENIAYATQNASRADIEAAAAVACANTFVEEMPQGYDTELGERGGKLSTGQRQRLSIARAILRDTPVLILDEPTASLDARTEHEVLENLADWGKHRVVFLITHRLSTIRNADQIAFLEDGRIVEMGSHDELMKLGDGRYRRFVNAEVEGVVTAEGSES